MNQLQSSFDFDRALDSMQQSAHGPRLGQIFKGKPPTGDELKEDGMAKATRKKEAALYRDRLIDGLKLFPVGARITAEHLIGEVGRPPAGVSFNAIGPAFNKMARCGMIRKTGRYVKATRRERHSDEAPEYEIVHYDSGTKKRV